MVFKRELQPKPAQQHWQVPYWADTVDTDRSSVAAPGFFGWSRNRNSYILLFIDTQNPSRRINAKIEPRVGRCQSDFKSHREESDMVLTNIQGCSTGTDNSQARWTRGHSSNCQDREELERTAQGEHSKQERLLQSENYNSMKPASSICRVMRSRYLFFAAPAFLNSFGSWSDTLGLTFSSWASKQKLY